NRPSDQGARLGLNHPTTRRLSWIFTRTNSSSVSHVGIDGVGTAGVFFGTAASPSCRASARVLDRTRKVRRLQPFAHLVSLAQGGRHEPPPFDPAPCPDAGLSRRASTAVPRRMASGGSANLHGRGRER